MDSVKKQNDPSAESLEEMPEINDERFRRRPGRGHHVDRSTGEIKRRNVNGRGRRLLDGIGELSR